MYSDRGVRVDNNIASQARAGRVFGCRRLRHRNGRFLAEDILQQGRFVHDPKLKYDVGENIAMSSPSENPITIWKNSAGHYRNMVDREFKSVGVAMATNGKEWYYVMRLK